MRGLILGMLLFVGAGQAMANPLSEVGEATVDGARWTGHTLGAGLTWVIVNTDKGLEWTEAVLHQKVIHPLVNVVTLGYVTL